ncbi:MAG: histidine--tRNA ligase [Candidatus Anoxymicrobium japonicum]|uniref:Histidine--tRNA ligase n=1 Tax=Candidatus Anoxymicrobium japonicum TaxID=2013648 RepID=A0A2N3G811_9ACTN|nr:MAG: histidine--tRNA ligase [Candidatus Anoxymicrobium japonicum]
MKYRAPKGTFDLVYPDSEKANWLVRSACEVMALYGYERIITPIIESADLFRRGIGDDSDIVTKEMYSFEDQGGESLTLRPEGTAPVARAFIERGLASRGLPQKLYYAGPMFRRERPQAGRFRQFFQVGAEAIGSVDPFIDAEIIAISDHLFKRLGLSGYTLFLNNVGCGECRPKYMSRLSEFLGAVIPALCGECQRRASLNPLRVLDCKNGSCRRAVADAPTMGSYLCGRCRENFDAVMMSLDRLSITFEIDERMVRGLDYYTGTAFEFQFEGLGAQNTVSAGGRYDYLIEQLGGPPTPGVGYSLGVERLVMALDAQGLDPCERLRLDLFIAGAPGVDRDRLLDILARAREEGISADTDVMGRGLKAQMKQADRMRARLVLIIGPDELERGEVTVRDLDASEQWQIPVEMVIEKVIDFLKRIMGSNQNMRFVTDK